MSNSGQTVACHPFTGQPWTVIALVAIGTSYAGLLTYLILRYIRGSGGRKDFAQYQDGWRYRLPGWPKEDSFRGSTRILFTWRLLNLCLAISCVTYQWLPIHYYSDHGKYNMTLPPHSSSPRMYRFYTVWNFHLVLLYFFLGTIFSFQGMIATKKVDSVDQMIIEPHHAPSYYERSAGLSKSIPGYLERIHHCIMVYNFFFLKLIILDVIISLLLNSTFDILKFLFFKYRLLFFWLFKI